MFIKETTKGMRDILPREAEIREYLLNKMKKTYASFGFSQIETPCVEHIENLTSKQGGDNEKLIFKVMKRGADLQRTIDKGTGEFADNGLRYDLTVPLARYYACNKEKLPSPFKALQMGNVYRADNPQKGRFRQFVQCDIDILGDGSNLAEIELITATASMLTQIFAEAGIENFTIHVNDRRMLSAVALCAGFKEEDIGSVLISLDKFDKIGLDGIQKSDAGVRVCAGVDDDAIDSAKGLLNLVDQNALVVALEYFHLHVQRLRGVFDAGDKVGIGFRAVDARLTQAEHVQVWAI